MKYLVMDFGGTLVKYSIMNENADVIKQGEVVAPTDSKEHFINFLVDLYERESEEQKLDGIAISMPGVIDEKTGYLKSAGAYLPLYGMNLFDELKGRIPVPVSVENDGKCGALAEVWKGGLREAENGIVLIIGTGMAGGIILDRHIYKGKSLSAGEFSYVFVNERTDLRGTVLFNCCMSTLLYETMRDLGIDLKKDSHYAMLSAFFGDGQTLTEWNDKPEYAEGMNGYQFFELLDQGNPVAVRKYDNFVTSLAKLAINLQIEYAADRILIGGGVSRQSRLIPDVQKKYDEMNKSFMGLLDFSTELAPCEFGNEANQYGALFNFLQQQGQL